MTKQQLIVLKSVEKGYYVDKNGYVFNKNGKKLSANKCKNGYLSFNIRLGKGEKPTRSFIHKLQAFQKFGAEMFLDGIVVRHLNGESTDNSYENIEIGTYKDNSLDIPKDKRVINSSKANKKYDHNEIIKDANNGYTFSQIMDKYGIKSKGTISFIINKSLESINKKE
jgi:hypothetical protein